MDILAIIQARTGSTRLKNKVLMDLEDKTVLDHVIDRVKACSSISEVMVATTITREDMAIVKLCVNKETRVFCGSENDVLDRFYQAARLLEPKHIVRITSDCPLIDPDVIKKTIKKHLSEKADYTSNALIETYPDGLDTEVIRFTALEEAWKKAGLKSEREHVTPYIRNNPKKFKQACLKYKEDLSEKRWTLDNEEDYKFISEIYGGLYHKNKLFGMEEILDYLKKNPKLEQINSHISRNEGYKKSLEEDEFIG